jgi:hypothetical protein
MKVSGRLPYRVLIKLFNMLVSNKFTSLLPQMFSEVVSYLVSRLVITLARSSHVSDGMTVQKYSELDVIKINQQCTNPTHAAISFQNCAVTLQG